MNIFHEGNQMLVLTRKQDETIVIDGRIKVKVMRIRGKAVRIGIAAPAEIAIRRSELSDLSRERSSK